jgi:multimeric flavodoxin WrbA
MAQELSPDYGSGLTALGLNCTLKKSPETSNTEALMSRVMDLMSDHGAETEILRPVDYEIPFGVTSDEGDGDEWPQILEKINAADILLMGMSIWFGVRSSVMQMVIERLDGTYNETNDNGQYPLYNKVAGVVVTGNEDGAHHVINEIAGALGDVGFTIPGQAWTYWNKGPGPGPSYTETDEGHDWSASTGEAAAGNLVAVARALEATPMPPPAGA